MQQTRRSKFKWFALLAVLGVILWLVWSLFGLHVNESRGPITASRAESITGLRPPAEAKNIRAASYSQWIEYAQYFRFEAPVNVCLRYASAVMPGATTRAADEQALASDAHPPRADAFRDFTWFDLGSAQKVVTLEGRAGEPQIWVDEVRGVFYYRKTD